MRKPRVTIILTVYERREFVKRCIESVLAQSYSDLEVLVCDDSADPFFKEIVEGFEDPRLRYIASKPRVGVALSVRRALGEAKGRFFAIVNDDDLWHPELLSCLVPALEADESLMLAFCNMAEIDIEGNCSLERSFERDRIQKRDMLSEGVCREAFSALVFDQVTSMAMGAVARRDAFDPASLSSDVGGAYDHWIICIIALSELPVFYLNKRLFFYRRHSAMESKREYVGRWESELFIARQLVKKNVNPARGLRLRRHYSKVCGAVGMNKLAFGLKREARAYFKDGIAVSFNVRCCAGIALSFFPDRIRSSFLFLHRALKSSMVR